jgi:hypothetical protein
MLVFNKYFYKNKKSKLYFGDRIAVLNDFIYQTGWSNFFFVFVSVKNVNINPYSFSFLYGWQMGILNSIFNTIHIHHYPIRKEYSTHKNHLKFIYTTK